MSLAELAAVIAACSSLLVAIAQLVVAVRTSRTADRTHNLVNGQSRALRAVARERGRQAGLVDAERLPGGVGKSPTDVGRNPHDK